jgi:polysaccharide biosynthesis protein PelE
MTNVLPLRTIDDYLAPVDVHDALRAPRGGALTCVVGLLVLAAESWLVYEVLHEGISVPGVIFLHLVLVAALAFYARALLGMTGEGRFALLLLIAVAAAGPYGAAGLVVSTLLYWLFDHLSSPFSLWHATMFPRRKISEAERIYTDIAIGRDESEKIYSVIPFLDVLSFGSEIQKRQALAKIAANFHPLFAPVLKKALGDISNTIRVQAAVAITRIEQQFTERQMQLSVVEKLHPDDPIVLLALARHYDNYAYTGLLDAHRETANRTQALDYYRRYLARKSEDVQVRSDIGRLLMRSGEYKEAAEWFRQCIDLGYGTPTIAQWHAEALFRCGRYGELRQYSHAVPSVPAEHATHQPALTVAIDLWKTKGTAA